MTKSCRYIAAALVLLVGWQYSHAAEYSNHPGYLDPSRLSFIDGRQPSVEVTLNGPVLKMLLQLPIQYGDDGEVKELLKVIEQVLVRVYTLNEQQTADTLEYIDETSNWLESDNWQRIVRVREDSDENVDIHVKVSDDGENLNGLVVMALEKHNDDSAEVVFVNIAGNFNPAYLANLGGQFDIDYLDGVEMP